jgi:hypothetical protein
MSRFADELHAIVLALLAGLLLPELLWPDAPLFRSVLTADVMHPATAILKLALQLSAAYAAFACAGRFAAKDRTRRSWRWLGVGMLLMAGGQLVLAWWQLARQSAAPFPSLADALFVPATIVLATGLADFASAHARSGFSVGGRALAWRTAGIATVLLVLILLAPVHAVLDTSAPPLTRTIAVAYPLLDLLLLVPTIVVLRQTAHLRGGKLWRAWLTVLAGVIALAVGDLAFAYFSTLGLVALDPLLDFAFASGYLLVGWGARIHRAALA